MTNGITLWLKDIFLACVQGGAEIFPVSSSGHLVLFGYALGRPLTFERILFLHLGPFLAILIFFRKQVWSIFTGQEGWKLSAYFAVSFGATAGLGFYFRALAERLVAGQAQVVAFLLVINGLVLGVMSGFFLKGQRSISELRTRDFLIIGLAQSLTAMPGISRLGFTLGMGLLLGLSWFEALNLSFILSIPTVLFANLYIWMEQIQGSTQAAADLVQTSAGPMTPAAAWTLNLVALSVSFIAAWIALNLLFKHFSRKLMGYLSVYCVTSGLFFILLLKL